MFTLVDARAGHIWRTPVRYASTRVNLLRRIVRGSRGWRPGPHLVAGKSELLGEQLADVARADEAHWAVQRSRVGHELKLGDRSSRQQPTGYRMGPAPSIPV